MLIVYECVLLLFYYILILLIYKYYFYNVSMFVVYVAVINVVM